MADYKGVGGKNSLHGEQRIISVLQRIICPFQGVFEHNFRIPSSTWSPVLRKHAKSPDLASGREIRGVYQLDRLMESKAHCALMPGLSFCGSALSLRLRGPIVQRCLLKNPVPPSTARSSRANERDKIHWGSGGSRPLWGMGSRLFWLLSLVSLPSSPFLSQTTRRFITTGCLWSPAAEAFCLNDAAVSSASPAKGGKHRSNEEQAAYRQQSPKPVAFQHYRTCYATRDHDDLRHLRLRCRGQANL